METEFLPSPTRGAKSLFFLPGIDWEFLGVKRHECGESFIYQLISRCFHVSHFLLKTTEKRKPQTVAAFCTRNWHWLGKYNSCLCFPHWPISKDLCLENVSVTFRHCLGAGISTRTSHPDDAFCQTESPFHLTGLCAFVAGRINSFVVSLWRHHYRTRTLFCEIVQGISKVWVLF